jgi:chromosome segregation ATPase
MAKGKQEKKPPRVESEEEEEDKDDLEFDKLSKKDMIKIKRLIERIEEQEMQLEQQEEYLIGKIEELKALHEEHEKLKHSHTSLIDSLEKENANLKTQLEVLTSKHVKCKRIMRCSTALMTIYKMNMRCFKYLMTLW